MEKISTNQKGITMIAMIISIIVIIILSAISIAYLMGENSIISQADRASTVTEFAGYKEQVVLQNINQYIEDELKENAETSLMYNIILGEEVKQIIPNLPDELIGQIVIIDNEITYITDVITEEVLELENLGYQIIGTNDLEYRIELQMIENAVEIIKENGYQKIGDAVATLSYPENVQVAGISYGEGWHILGDGDSNGSNQNILDQIEKIESIEITDEEKEYFKNSPYIVTYADGYVQSIEGKSILEDTERETWKYSYNYNGELDGILTNNLLTAVIDKSEKTETKWGDFDNYGSEFSYRENGENSGLITGESVAYIEISEQNKINDQYTISVVVEGTTNQISTEYSVNNYPDGVRRHGKTILAISNTVNNYTCWMSIVENNLRVYVYNNINKMTAEDGFISIDVSEYDNKFMHIQVTAKKGGEAKVYINGELKATFSAGAEVLPDHTLTIGDLRPGRNLKYEGTVYDVAIYGKELTDQELLNNWNYVKSQFQIDESGTQY